MIQSRHYNKSIEGLRGVAALCVVLHHLCQDRLDSNVNLSKFIGFGIPGHVFVMIFFMLSGYVIGLTNPREKKENDVSLYLKKRFVRIYPIYFIVVVLSFLLSNDTWRDFAYTIVFGQNIWADNLSTNRALWSLNHEILYYFLFIPIMVFKTDRWYFVMLFSLFIGLLCLIVPSLHPLIPAYGIGFFFWLTGLYLAWFMPDNGENEESHNQRFFLPAILMLIYSQVLNPLYAFIPKVDLNQGFGNQNIVNVYDLALWPYCLAALVVYSNKRFAYTHVLIFLCQLVSFSYIALYCYKGLGWDGNFIAMNVAFWSSVVFSFAKMRRPNWLKPFEYIGLISFALYVIHMPLMYLLKDLSVFDSVYCNYSIKLVIFLFLLFVIAHVLERVLQPKIRDLFFSASKKNSQ